MRTCTLLILLLGLAGCNVNSENSIGPEDIKTALELCAPNSGLKSIGVGYTYIAVFCHNGANFIKDKRRT